ncbi:SDR family NAD(P)-dependent oxidoreductase [Devosia nitrariae]|uniref:Oxidoreductase n=1 Tax=Devosia nitrariae TaxID=2071872 RepID=A0ABQ5VYE2_9HYPH|nr:SDR family NAD(P)-dependent oxidoreductase [Devosia nitrariae]GLQ52832.1 oxidoreductase [Devosia nitrariae]
MDHSFTTIVVTGSTDGLGRAVALELAAPGRRLILHGRDLERGEEVRRGAVEKGAQAQFHRADFASLAEVRALAETIGREVDRVDLLINNAGIGFGPPLQRRQTSVDGLELRLAVNYLAPYLLTELLRPLILARPPSRVINVASAGQHPIDFSNLMLTEGYSGSRAYRQAKLAMIMWTMELAAELGPQGVTVVSLHPAPFMNTTMVRQAWGVPMSSVAQGVAAVMNLVEMDIPPELNGAYFNGLSRASPHAQAQDVEVRRQLVEMTRKLVGLDAEVGAVTRTWTPGSSSA